ncbi:MAG: hypothetical protein MJ158_01920 [Alphaproteobacteria bacterium]|nr:hypothetical protein [Alphaproteobacteria bacterium]
MKRVLCIFFFFFMFAFGCYAANGRGENSVTRSSTKGTVTRTAKTNTSSKQNTTERISRTATTKQNKVATRTPSVSRNAVTIKTVTKRSQPTNLLTRAAVVNDKQENIETRTGETYNICKTAFFTCMDQFCTQKNDTYRRCSCSDRVYEFEDITKTFQSANEQLTAFTENLDVVGLTTEQVMAMKTASEGEEGLLADKSASKQLLQAIMNSINGSGDTSVGGKYSNLNSVNMSFDPNASTFNSAGQLVSSYNGSQLYSAVYTQCRDVVAEQCNKSSLQRAVNAYLMSIEQDCNTVATALKNQQKQLYSATYETGAMLDLARIENRQKHNSKDVSECIADIENIIQSETICGKNYHRCLDNGKYIDITTGAPLTGVSDFYKLAEILTYSADTNITEQKLASIPANTEFVKEFENKTKHFVLDTLDTCSEKADFVWQEYLNKALVDIFYAQRSKVDEIKQSCFDIIANCYDNQNNAIENAITNLTGDYSTDLQPSKYILTNTMCANYVDSCSNLFTDNIIKTYMDNKKETDVIATCKAIAKQCFDKNGGNNYEMFYKKDSFIFESGQSLDWFSLYDSTNTILSPCAQQLQNIKECEPNLEQIFGGFDKIGQNNYTVNEYEVIGGLRRPRQNNGVATMIFNQIINILTVNCNSLNGEFKLATNLRSTVPGNNKLPKNYTEKVDINSWGWCECKKENTNLSETCPTE